MLYSRSCCLAPCFWARSCDLTRLDFYLWATVKDSCYADKPETIGALNENIRKAIGETQLHTIDNVLKNCRLLHGQPRQPFEWNYFPLLTRRIVLSNTKWNLRKYSAFFLKHFPRKKYLWDPIVFLFSLYSLA